MSFLDSATDAIRKVQELIESNLRPALAVGILGFIALTISSTAYLNGSTFYGAATGGEDTSTVTLIIPIIISAIGLYGSLFNQLTCLKLVSINHLSLD